MKHAASCDNVHVSVRGEDNLDSTHGEEKMHLIINKWVPNFLTLQPLKIVGLQSTKWCMAKLYL